MLLFPGPSPTQSSPVDDQNAVPRSSPFFCKIPLPLAPRPVVRRRGQSLNCRPRPPRTKNSTSPAIGTAQPYVSLSRLDIAKLRVQELERLTYVVLQRRFKLATSLIQEFASDRSGHNNRSEKNFDFVPTVEFRPLPPASRISTDAIHPSPIKRRSVNRSRSEPAIATCNQRFAGGAE